MNKTIILPDAHHMRIADLDKETRRIVYLAHILTTRPSNAVLRKLRNAVEAFDHKHADERTRNLIRALFDNSQTLPKSRDEQEAQQ